MKKVEVILVKFNQPALEAQAIRRVLATAHPNYSLTAYQNERNKGLARTWNHLIAASDAEFICLLNSDTYPTEGWLENLCNVLENEPDIAAVVPSSNKVHMSQIPVPFPDDTMDPQVFEEFAAGFEDFNLVDLETCSAMCVVFRKSVWRQAITTQQVVVGAYVPYSGFDEDFFLYGEDTEFFYRIRRMGLGRIVWHTGVYVHHYGQQSMAAEYDNERYLELRRKAAALWDYKKRLIDATYGQSRKVAH